MDCQEQLTLQTFQNAIFYLNSFADKGGAKLFVPAGRWLTGSFDLISHLTLWLDKDAVILGSNLLILCLPMAEVGNYLVEGIGALYGRNLTDVIITGENGTIDGQGSVWWNWFRRETLNYTRPDLIELMNSTGIVISNLTFLNSPFWTIHPVYCSHVIVQNVTILAPLDSPNTDGIDPDSSDDVCIEDCYISTGDDLIAIKSGWDEYGISFARPSTNIIIRRLIGNNRNGSGIAIGSEMSGGISEVYAENLYFFDSSTAIIIKTAPGRGGYVRNIYISNVTLVGVDTAIWFDSNASQHPDELYDPNALPVIERITVKDVVGDNIKVAGLLKGIERDTFNHVCLLNISLNVTSKSPWNCSYIQGYSALVTPETCEPLKESVYPNHSSDCYHLSNHLRSSGYQNRGSWLLSW
ncbi:Detected protein of confused Function [Hibiscus syriacus]|uniref:Detected protein of confused Function n=1 Tax=Hibiscus syriacus TaxID=106335 RepID=A0A6A2Z0V5_HIBSY|nr:Detected protein of confused Function [Hibiscus syriacus]